MYNHTIIIIIPKCVQISTFTGEMHLIIYICYYNAILISPLPNTTNINNIIIYHINYKF